MKRQNHEEVYTSSTRSTPRGKRLLSWLLSMVMLLALLPATEIHVHAGYEDGADISVWAQDAVKWAVGAGLLSGKGGGILDPHGTATRAEVAQIFMNFCKVIAE